MKLHKLLAVLLIILLLVSCNAAQDEKPTEKQPQSPSEEPTSSSEEADPTESEKETEEEQSVVHKWQWMRSDTLDLQEYLKDKVGFVKIMDRELYKSRLLLALEDQDDKAVSGRKTKELFICELGMKPSLSLLHSYEQDTRVWSAAEAEEGLYSLELYPSETLENSIHVKLMLYKDDGSEELLDEFHVDDFRRVSKFVRTKEGLFYLRNAYVIEEGKASFMDSDFCILRQGKKESLFHARASLEEGIAATKDEIFHSPYLTTFEDRVAFSTRKEGKSTLYLYSEGGLVDLHPDKAAYNFTLLKDHAICTVSPSEGEFELCTMNLETLELVPQTKDMDSPWQWPIQFDQFVSVFYQEEFIPEKNEADTMTGTIKALWVDEKGMIQTKLLTETEHIVEAKIQETIAVNRGNPIISLVEEEVGDHKQLRLVFYGGHK